MSVEFFCISEAISFYLIISPEIMRDIFHFQENENYNLRSGTHLASRNIIKNQIEAFFVEIRIRNSIWLLSSSYNPNKLKIASHIQEILMELMLIAIGMKIY